MDKEMAVFLSWVTPLIPKDVDRLPELISAINRQTHPVGEFVLVSSGCSASDLERLDSALGALTIPFRHVRRKRLHAAGSNRNAGVRVASHSWISFIDADDLPHPRRNEVLIDTISLLGDAFRGVIVHGFHRIPRDLDFAEGRMEKHFPEVSTMPAVFEEVTPDRVRRIREAVRRRGFRWKYPELRFSGAPDTPIHHAHVTLPLEVAVKNRIPVRPVRRGEDVIYLNRLFVKGVAFRFIDAPLVLYREGWIHPPEGDQEDILVPFPVRRRLHQLFRVLTKRLRRLARRVVRGVGASRHSA